MVFAALVLCVLCFVGGFFYANATRLNVPKFKVAVPLEIQEATGEIGLIPRGVSLYRQQYSGEVATFFMLVNVAPGYLSSLSPAGGAM